MKTVVERHAVYKGVRVFILWEEGSWFHAMASVTTPLPDRFFSRMTRPDTFEYEGDIPVDDPNLHIEE